MQEKREDLYPLSLNSDMFNETLAMKPFGYQALLMSLLSCYRIRYPFDRSSLLTERNISWVILAMVIDIRESLHLEAPITGRTWNTERQGVVLRRENAVLLPDGRAAVTGAMFHAPFDMGTRHILRDETLYGNLQPMEGTMLLRAGSRCTEIPEAYQRETELRVLPSWIDFVGHVNTARYGEIAYLALDAERQKRMPELSRLEFYFLRELPPDTLLRLRLSETEDSSFITGFRNAEDEPAFFIRMEFKRR